MSKRNENAIIISDGASNPRAILRAMLQAENEITAEGNTSTHMYLTDPALKLMVHQLCFLMNIPTSEDLLEWEEWRRACLK